MLKEAICARNITKTRDIRVLKDVSFMVFQGEILGMVGGHGAGISSLLNILLGSERCDSGTIDVEGRRTAFNSQADASRAGIYRVDRTNLLVDGISVAENICLTDPPVTRSFPVSRREVERKAEEILKAYGVDIDVREIAYNLSEFERNVIEVIKMTLHSAKVLIFDNVMLNYNAVQRREMKRLIEKLTGMGIAIIIVSPEAESIIDVVERMIVIVDGRVEGAFFKNEFDLEVINALIDRRRRQPQPKYWTRAPGIETLRLVNLEAGGLRFPDSVIRSGEIVGALDAHGHVDKTLIGVLKGKIPYAGTIFIDERRVSIRGPRDAMRHGIAYLTKYDSPEMRLEDLSIMDNLLLANPRAYQKFGCINRRLLHFACREYMKMAGLPPELMEFQPKYLNAHTCNELNLIRLRTLKPRILLLDDPFIDVDAVMKDSINALIDEVIRMGACVISGITSEEEQQALVMRSIAPHPGRALPS